MASAEDAQNAIKKFHETMFPEGPEGRPLTVNVARPLAERPPQRNGGNGGGFDRGARW
jgi:hypothetical protein